MLAFGVVVEVEMEDFGPEPKASAAFDSAYYAIGSASRQPAFASSLVFWLAYRSIHDDRQPGTELEQLRMISGRLTLSALPSSAFCSKDIATVTAFSVGTGGLIKRSEEILLIMVLANGLV